MKPKTRNLIQYIVFSIAVVIIIRFVYCSIIANNSVNTIASVSLLIAVTSLFLTTLSFNYHLDAKLPQIVIDTDCKSRYGLILLSIKNYGDKTAYNIEILWDRPIVNYKGENILSQDKDCKIIKIPVLQKEQELKVTIDEIGSFYDKYTDNELKFTGEIKYSLALNKKRILKNTFVLDLSVYRKTLYHGTESLKAFYDLQKIPKELKEIKDLLKNK
jgi:hypothetical protein